MSCVEKCFYYQQCLVHRKAETFISLVLGTGTDTQVVLKYIFRVLVLLACKVLVLVLVLESLVLVLVLVTKYLLPRRKFSYVVETLQV